MNAASPGGRRADRGMLFRQAAVIAAIRGEHGKHAAILPPAQLADTAFIQAEGTARA
jgi:hypothetical protein